MPPLLSRLSGPAPLSWVATSLAVLWLCGRDAATRSPATALFLLGGTASAALALWCAEAVWMRVPFERWLRREPRALAELLVAFGPLLLLIGTLGSGLLEPGARWLLPGAAVLGGALMLALCWLARRARPAPAVNGAVPAGPRSASGAVLAALEILLVFVWMHRSEGTFVAMRPGTETLHGLLFFGTWLVSAALLVPWSMRLSARVAVLPVTRWRLMLCASAGLVGLASIEIDRRELVDLYPAVHVWLELVGLLSLDAALAPLLAPWWLAASAPGAAGASITPRRARLVAGLAVAGGALLLLPTLGFAALLGSAKVRDGGFRAELLDTALGPALIELAPRPRRSTRQHPLLRYEQFLDVRAPDNDWNIVLVSSDAMRADAIVAPGSKDVSRSPRITKFAAERCGFFRTTYAPGSLTPIGMGALMIGRYSAYIHWDPMIWKGGRLHRPELLSKEQRKALGHKKGYTVLPRIPSRGNLAQRLKAAKLRTLGVPWDSFAAFFDQGQGFEHGFDVYADMRNLHWKPPTSSKAVGYALEQLDKHARRKGKYRRFFQWLHLFDTHTAKGNAEVYWKRVTETDAAVGELLHGLEQRKLLDRTVLVLLADHGEALGEHRVTLHGTNLYEEQVRVPMLLCVPGIAPRIYEQPVSTLDAVATLLVLARAKLDGIDGVNLMPLLTGGLYPKRRPVFTELHRYKAHDTRRTVDLRAVRIGDWKLIKDLLHESSKLYDLAHDPGELDNQVGQRPEVAEELGSVLDAFIAEGERATGRQ